MLKDPNLVLVVSIPFLRRNFAISDCIKCLDLSLGQGLGSSITLLPCLTASSISCFFCSMSSVTWKVTRKALSVGTWAGRSHLDGADTGNHLNIVAPKYLKLSTTSDSEKLASPVKSTVQYRHPSFSCKCPGRRLLVSAL